MFPDFRETAAFTFIKTIPTLRSFVVLVKTKRRRRWVQGICGMTLTGENKMLGEKLVLITGIFQDGRSHWPGGLRRGSAADRFLGLRVRM